MARTSVVLLVGEQTGASASWFPAVSSSMPCVLWAPLPEAGGFKKESKKILFCTTAEG
jgi:hypothetical protein